MLVNMKEILYYAKLRNYAVGSFNIYSYETMKGVLDSAKYLNTPVILAFGEKYLENMGFELVCELVKILSNDIEVPIALHLDHCNNLENLYRAIKAGFTSVMYDGSFLPYEQNVANTLKAVEVAHSCNVSVEAELGSLAAGENSHEGKSTDEEVYTDPLQAKDFVQKTNVDVLAVSIGTVHGMYRGTPNIRVDILKKINEEVGIPLALHGGSGIPEDIIKNCIQNGICKVNVNTEVSSYTAGKMRSLLNEEKQYHLSQISLKQIDYIKEIVCTYMKIFK